MNFFFKFKETEKKLLRPLLSSGNSGIQQQPAPIKSAAPVTAQATTSTTANPKGLNHGIPVFTHERAEERAATKKNNVTPHTNRIYLENDFIITKLNHFNFSYY